MSADLVAALLDALDDRALGWLADQIAPRIAARTGSEAQGDDRWLTTAEAASHLGISINALHKLSAARLVPFEQDGPGCKLFFKRGDLDDWRRGRPIPRRTAW